jgi:hypothetical protein
MYSYIGNNQAVTGAEPHPKNLAHTIYIYTPREKHLYTTVNFDRLHESLKGFSYLHPTHQRQKAPDVTILLYAHDHKSDSKLLACFNLILNSFLVCT